MHTYNDHGEVESGHVLFQIKATDSIQMLKGGPFISVRVEVANLKAWHDEWMPVILVIYDAGEDRAFWLYVQQYLDERNVSGDDFLTDQDRVTVRIPLKNRLDQTGVEQIRQSRNTQLERSKRSLRHEK